MAIKKLSRAKAKSSSSAKKPAVKKKTLFKTTHGRKKGVTRRKPNAAFMKPMTPSSTLAAVVGSSPMPRSEVTSKLWAYIKKNNLQDKTNRRMINADDKLRKIFKSGGGDDPGPRKQVSMFEMSKLIAKHLK